MPTGVSAVPPPRRPPDSASTTGDLKQRFIVSTRSHARRYDMPSFLAADVIDPVLAMASSRSTLPGPTAMLSPRVMRRRKFTLVAFGISTARPLGLLTLTSRRQRLPRENRLHSEIGFQRTRFLREALRRRNPFPELPAWF